MCVQLVGFMATSITRTAGAAHPTGVAQRLAGLTSWMLEGASFGLPWQRGGWGLCRESRYSVEGPWL